MLAVENGLRHRPTEAAKCLQREPLVEAHRWIPGPFGLVSVRPSERRRFPQPFEKFCLVPSLEPDEVRADEDRQVRDQRVPAE